MRRFGSVAAFLALATSATIASDAFAQSSQTWVAGFGSDTADCSRAAPCATFVGAYAKTNAGGEIRCLNGGEFGGLQISKSLTVDCTGVEGGAMSSSADQLDFWVTAGPTDVVVLRGLDFEGSAPGVQSADGVKLFGAGTVVIQHCLIRGFVFGGSDGNGVMINNHGAMKVFLDDLVIEDNVDAGVWVQPQPGDFGQPGGSLQLTMNRLVIRHNTFGILLASPATVGKIAGTLRDSIVTSNSQDGVAATEASGAIDVLAIDRDSIVGNGNRGLVATGASAGFLVSGSTIAGNASGVESLNSGVIASYGDNRVNGNFRADGVFTLTIAKR